jgi:hypothetical protein
MAEVFLCEKGQLTDPAKHDLRKAGIVVAEVADISKARFIRASEVVAADDMLWAAMSALQNQEYGHGEKQREALARNLIAIVDRDFKRRYSDG